VAATAATDAAVNDQDAGVVNVVGNGVDVDITPPSGAPGSSFQLQVTNTGQNQDVFDLTLGGPVGVISTLSATSISLAPGASQTVDIAMGPIDFAFPGSLELVGTATSQGNAAVQDSDTALVSIAATKDMTAEFEQDTIELPDPGEATFLLLVHNIGNLEDAYKAEIMGATGPVTAALDGLDGQPTSMIDTFRLPGLATGVLVLKTTLAASGEGQVTVRIISLTDGTIVDTSVATVRSGGVPPLTLDPFLCYRTKSTKGDLCAADAPLNAGGACVTEEDCGGRSESETEEETDFCLPNKFPRGLEVTLDDSFENGVFDLRKPVNLCNPAAVDGVGIDDPATHLRGFAVKLDRGQCSAEAPQRVGAGCRREEECGGVSRQTNYCIAQPKFQQQTKLQITNALHAPGELRVDLLRPERLMRPASKDHVQQVPPPAPATLVVDPYMCYRVRVSPGTTKFPTTLRARVVDQFAQERLYDLKRPTRLCAPAAVNDGPVKDVTQNLLCYQVKATPKVCAPETPTNAGGVCKKEADCGGVQRQSTFCQAQPKHEKVTGVFVNTEVLPEQIDTIREDELCLPSQVLSTP
jgi:hypothetical protein